MPSPRVLLIHGGALGDGVLALQLLIQMRSLGSEVHLAMAARSGIVRWAKKHALVDEAYSLSEVNAVLQESNVIIDCIDFFQAQPAAPLRACKLYSLDPKTDPTLTQDGMHIVEQWRLRLRNQGLDMPSPSKQAVQLQGREALRERLRSYLHAIDRAPIVLCHPGSGGQRKVLPIEEFESVVRAIHSESFMPVWMIGPDEMERYGESYAVRLRRSAPLIAEEDIVKAADFVAGADHYIGFDAGMTHVAALAGVSTVALFGPTDPRVWSPLGPNVRVIQMEFDQPLGEVRFDSVIAALRVLDGRGTETTAPLRSWSG